METIIQEFLEEMLKLNIEEGLSEFLTKGSNYLQSFFLEFTRYRIEELDELVFSNKNIRQGYFVQRKGDARTFETKHGTLTFHRRYYVSKDKEYVYLTDKLLGIDSYDRVEKGLCANLCKTATETSYAKSSKLSCEGRVSKQTVMRLLRDVEEKPIEIQETRNHIKEIHIQCDEDHVAMQDKSSSIVKMATIHEEIQKQGNSKRRYLPEKHIVSSQSYETNEEYWYRILDTINKKYGIREDDNPLAVYIHGDGASWIKAGVGYVTNSHFVLDKYHFKQKLVKVSGNEESYIKLMWDAVRTNKIGKVRDMVDIFMNSEICTQEVADDFFRYYLNNYEGIKIWKKLGPNKSSSCAEGLVSHILSERLSSRPKGWSNEGLDAVSRLRVHCLNGGDITAQDFTSSIEDLKSPLLNLKEIRQNTEASYDFAPFVTDACRRTKRDGLYRLLTNIAEGGYKF